MSKRHMVIPIFVPNRGCPFDCIYCNQKLISGQMDEMNESRMKQIIESHLKTAGKDTFVEIGFFGGSFTGIEREQQIRFLKLANEYIHLGYIQAIKLSTRPDYIHKDILKYLKDYNVKTIELGVQSLDPAVLSKSCRGHSADIVVEAVQLIKEEGFNLGIQTMIGLPGDTRETSLETAKKIIGLKPGFVRIYPTLVIKGTYLEKMYLEGAYRPLSLEKAVECCSELLELYEKNNIQVIRVGLQPSNHINEGKDVISGPFHPAFRQLVESRRILRKIEQVISNLELSGEYEIDIYTGLKNFSNVIGQKRGNIEYLKQRYNLKKIEVKLEKNSEEIFRIDIVRR